MKSTPNDPKQARSKNIFYVGLLSFFAGFLWDRFGSAVPFYFGAITATITAGLLFLLARLFTGQQRKILA